MSRMFKDKSTYIAIVAIAFVLFQSLILLNSFSAIYRIYTDTSSFSDTYETFWPSFWLFSELAGEIGLIMRFAGACLFVAFVWMLFRKKEFSFSFFRKTVLLEGVYYLFYIPFIILLFTIPENKTTPLTFRKTASSYTIQTILISLSFIVLYTKSRHPHNKHSRLARWGAIAVVFYIFALWIKHFMFNLYALPIDVANPVLLIGLLNSSLTMLIAALLLLVTLIAVIKGKTKSFSSRAVGVAFILVGTYFIIYILIALVNPSYMRFLLLTELWAITFAVLGLGFLKERSPQHLN